MPPKTPALSKPPTLSQPPTPVKPAAPPTSSEQPPPPPEQKPVETAAPAATMQKPVAGAVTLEYQRKVAKDLQDYFKQKKLEEANQGPLFGFLPKNEISNGSRNANRVRNRLGFCSANEDPSLQFWNCGLGLMEDDWWCCSV
ncbi:unnamed protein product [Urochloa decumbens]|uniref:Uncharacterized protein n=1 Tax=Urochloa decumbens TaxID=240449 RepID=A0ABC8YW45_9POAL